MSRPRRILTVCLGNICRSLLAAAVLARHGGPAVEVRSAGIRDKWTGEPAHPQMVAAAAAHGYDLTTHRAAQVTADLMDWADSILAMDVTNLAALQELARDERTCRKLSLYLGEGGRDVPDPFGKDPQAFTAVVELVERATAALLR
ncbi:low molecular weight protein-tyrosine-phosphatase [Streptomyces sp. AP-93]|uniref:low molecular weight protein-tyrosine-phosphatase n=1 Tax=Streptomyces sp. AP-93 TaxID=2929048 RepID=UPI001FAF2836|nr:low molecular weight protein-tyrosine-phosphatase [Streptomyces sp. AP-93]MCJ0868020.1 low molecular weight phosphotyrosine protein phosphatase [Streptomyces sp. AP-93]